jgi:hypothetical protein
MVGRHLAVSISIFTAAGGSIQTQQLRIRRRCAAVRQGHHAQPAIACKQGQFAVWLQQQQVAGRHSWPAGRLLSAAAMQCGIDSGNCHCRQGKCHFNLFAGGQRRCRGGSGRWQAQCSESLGAPAQQAKQQVAIAICGQVPLQWLAAGTCERGRGVQAVEAKSAGGGAGQVPRGCSMGCKQQNSRLSKSV